jgi:hypothetical protein
MKSLQYIHNTNTQTTFDTYENFKSEALKKEQNTVLIIPCWWDGKLARYKITDMNLEK